VHRRLANSATTKRFSTNGNDMSGGADDVTVTFSHN